MCAVPAGLIGAGMSAAACAAVAMASADRQILIRYKIN